jgi:SCY1-like protein 1
LGGFEVLTAHKSSTPFISSYGSLLPVSGRYTPPEIARAGWSSVDSLPIHAVDSWQLGVLVYEAFNGVLANPASEMGQRRNVPTSLWAGQRGLCNANPKQRVSVERFSKGGPLKTELVDISSKLHSLSIVEEGEFQMFLDSLKSVEDKFPRSYLHIQVLPKLITCLEYGKGGTRTLTTIIQISKDMPPETYKSIVLPVMLKMFTSDDKAIRMELLQGLPEYIEYLDKRVVSDKIYPALSTGFTDTEPAIREQTVKAVLFVAPKLYDRQLNSDLLRQLAITQNDAQQEIRANTTILLGKLAPLFSQNTRVAVLVTAFGRALKDPFVPSRLAALMALASTAEYFGAQETCGKIIGTVAPALIDKDKTVRHEATKAMEVFMKKVNEYIASLEKEDEEDGQQGSTGQSSWGGWTATIAAGLSSKLAASAKTGSELPSATISRTATPNQSELKPTNVTKPAVLKSSNDDSWLVDVDSWNEDDEIDFGEDEPTPVNTTPVGKPLKVTPLATKRPSAFGTTSFGGSNNTRSSASSNPRAVAPRKIASRPVAARKMPEKKKAVEDEDGWGDEWGEI